MHILITDSGVGGLSVVAYAERFVRTRGCAEPVRLTFANAAPANDYGYNSMPSHAAKVETFDRFLRNVTERFAPDMIYVACNTLSVLLPEVSIPAKGIIETAVNLLLKELDSTSVAMIFGTQTTIDAGTYPRLLQEHGIDAARIVSQACPGLADTISEDREGTKAEAEIRRCVAAAVAKLPRRPSPGLRPPSPRARGEGPRSGGEGRPAPIVACLACTHYGYRKEFFVEALTRAQGAGGGAQVVDLPTAETRAAAEDITCALPPAPCPLVINPNESAVDDLFHGRGGEHREVEVEFVTRYAIPEATIETLSWLLGDISPRTVAALRGFVHIPDLF